jgi:hypothetical protein
MEMKALVTKFCFSSYPNPTSLYLLKGTGNIGQTDKWGEKLFCFVSCLAYCLPSAVA